MYGAAEATARMSFLLKVLSKKIGSIGVPILFGENFGSRT